jgi:2-polyprenyl-3-methyl-5-hydroxy-6-metoxy-1,4-benzoquinol methylase
MRSYYEQVWTENGDVMAVPWALERRRAWLLARVSAEDRVLDLGCGAGVFTAALARAGAKPVGADVAEAALIRARAAHPGLDFVRVGADGSFGALDDNAFDAVWAGEVIEHVADTAAWLSEVRRVLVPGGRLLLSTPYHGRVKSMAIALGRFESHYDPVGEHLRFYTRRSLRGVLGDLGFVVAAMETQGGAPLLRETLYAEAVR